MKILEPIPRFLMVLLLMTLLTQVYSESSSSQARSHISSTRKTKEIAQATRKFSNTIEWPKQSKVRNLSQPFVIGIIGGKADLAGFSTYFSKNKIQNKAVVVKPIENLEEIDDCDLLFFAEDDTRDRAMIIASLEKRPVLTIGEGEDFLRMGGHISLTFKGFSMKFAVQIVALKHSNLKPSVYLLKSSEKVVRGK